MEECPDYCSLNDRDLSNCLSVINSLKPKSYLRVKNFYNCCDCSCEIVCSNNQYTCKYSDMSYNSWLEVGYFGEDISKNCNDLSFCLEKWKPLKSYDISRNESGEIIFHVDEHYDGNHEFYYLEKNNLLPYHTKAIQELHQLVLTQASTIAALESRISTLENT